MAATVKAAASCRTPKLRKLLRLLGRGSIGGRRRGGGGGWFVGGWGRGGWGAGVGRFLGGDVGYVEGIAESEVEVSFGGDADFLAVSRGLHGGAASSANAGADGCTLAASGETADDCAENGAAADNSGRTFAARLTFLLNITGRDAISFALIGEAIEGDGEFAGAVEAACGAGLDEFQIHVEASGDDEIAFQEHGSIEGAAKDMAGLAGGRIDAVNRAHGEDSA